MNSSIQGLVLLTRPVNVLIGAASVFVGALLTGRLQPTINVILACFSGALIMAAGNAINDYFDRHIDAVNCPHRPIPSGRVSPNRARALAMILFAFGFYVSIFVGSAAAAIAGFACLALVLYSLKLKRVCLAGNLLVSLLSASAFCYGAVAVGTWRAAIFPALFAFLFHLGREIIKDLEDREGDRVHGAATLPVRFGRTPALLVVTGVFTLLMAVTVLPYYQGVYDYDYFVTVLLGVDLIVALLLVALWRCSTDTCLHRVSVILKMDMIIGLVAIYVGL